MEMTLDEKLSLVSTYFPYTSPRAGELGMVLSSGFNPGLRRLGIPALRMTDASLGVANILNARPDDAATALPSSLAVGASFDPDLARAGGAVIGGEARAKRFNMLLGGGINLTRDPWAGRNFEYIGEDPLLTGVLGGASVDGIQSNNIASTVKHFALNAQETGRMVMDARLDAAAFRESDLLAFEIAIASGRPASVMTAYNKVNGDYASEHATLINDVLKGDWGFPGWVMSDWGAVHSTEKAVLAGLDQESAIELDQRLNGAIFFTDRLREAIAAGRVPESRLDDMVTRILTGMIESGVIDHPLPDGPGPIDVETNALAAQRIAETGSVLLRNEGGVLPLSRTHKRIAVIGGNADVGVLSGGGSSQVRSIGGVPIEKPITSIDGAWFCRMSYHASSPLRAIRELAPQSTVSFSEGTDLAEAARAAAEADVAIVFATQWRTETLDLETLALPDEQDALIAAVAAANPRTIVVLETGGPALMPWLQQVPAVLAAWYPGQRGGEAIARILFGEVNPSGRLPITFPAADTQAPRPVPPGLEELRARDAAREEGDSEAAIKPFTVDYLEGANVGYRWYAMTDQQPLFPFGFGLSYTSFDYKRLEILGGDAPRVAIQVTNSGARTGADVPQVYVKAADSSGIVTWRLSGFRRVELRPGETRRVEIVLEPRTFSRWDEERRRWRRPSEPLPLAIGRSATDFELRSSLRGSLT
jgi:beta-glucosidase